MLAVQRALRFLSLTDSGNDKNHESNISNNIDYSCKNDTRIITEVCHTNWSKSPLLTEWGNLEENREQEGDPACSYESVDNPDPNSACTVSEDSKIESANANFDGSYT